jgi:hypothetical protein
MYSQATNSPILKNLCQAKQEKYMNKKKLNINLVHHLWLDLDQGIYESNLTIRRRFSKNESIEDMKYCVRQDCS